MDHEHILQGLNPAQKSAVISPANALQVLAPPGSGKTKTLTARVAYLIAHYGLNPRNIIVCTFTVKAAKEMNERICGFLGRALAGQLILGTFHSIARRYLASYGKHIGLNEKFGIADASDSTSILARIIKRRTLGVKPAVAKSRISRLKAQSISSEQHSTSARKVEEQEFALVYTEYEEHLRVSNLLDYDDLLLRCAELLRQFPLCVSDIQAVLIDEFQDTNNVQFDLMQLFAQAKRVVTIVGDPDQSIYGWRSAEIRNLKRMQDIYPETLVITLEENYRSAGAILIAAQEIIEQDQSRPAKQLMPTHSVGMRPVLRKLPSAAAEASWIVSEIKRSIALTGNLLNYSDYAVLLRSASLSRLLETALGKAGIPYRMVGGHRFFDRFEVKLVLDYLRVIDHVDHNDAVARVINVPPRGVGDATVQGLLAEASDRRKPLWYLVCNIAQGNIKLQTKVSTQAQKGLEMFTNLILAAKRKLTEFVSGNESLTDFLEYILRRIGIEAHIKKVKPEEELESRLANVRELVAQASDTSMEPIENNLTVAKDMGDSVVPDDDTVEQALSKFLANVALSTEVQKVEQDGCRSQQITLSTIHAAKGLEWPVVFIPSAYEGSIPHSRAEDNDEERRLLYVAMTRAQSLLYLSCPMKSSQGEQTTLSPFLSQKPMESYFDKRGFDFQHGDAKELSVILRRRCPHPSDLEQALAGVEHVKDDQWPLGGQLDDDFESRWGPDCDDSVLVDASGPYKRCRIGGRDLETLKQIRERSQRIPLAGFPTLTTCQKASGFSSATATFSTSFVSAASVKLDTYQPPKPQQKVTKLTGDSYGETQKRSATIESKVATAQSNLTKFFSKSTTTLTEASNVPNEVTGVHTSLAQRHLPLQDLSTTTARINMAEQLTEHDLDVTLFRPAITLHETSLQSLQRRKTLGVRRSLNGWSSRRR